MSLVITIDKGVARPVEKADHLFTAIQNKYDHIEQGDSFFLANVSAADIDNALTRASEEMGIFLDAVNTTLDEIYQAPGVRVWCTSREEGGSSAPAEPGITYWQHKTNKTLRELAPGVLPVELPKWRQVAPAEYHKLKELAESEPVPEKKGKKAPAKKEEAKDADRKFEEETYWYHPESEATFALAPGDHSDLFSSADGAMCLQLDKAKFDERMAQEEAENGGNYWKDPDGLVVVERLPGRYPNSSTREIRATKAEYTYYLNKQLKETYWRRKNGTCVAVPREKLEKAMATAGAVQITVNEFRDWQQSQDDDEL